MMSLSLNSTLVPRLDYLDGIWPGELSTRRVIEYPNVLTMSLERNIKPTYDFLVRRGYKGEDIRGRHLAASLYKRIIRRWEYWEWVRGIETSEADTLGALEELEQNVKGSRKDKRRSVGPPPLHILVAGTDDKFQEWCGTVKLGLTDWAEGPGATAIENAVFTHKFGLWVETGKGGEALG